MDFENGGPVEPFTAYVSALPDLSQKVSAVAKAGCDAAGGRGAGQGLTGKRRCGFERVFYRWLFLHG